MGYLSKAGPSVKSSSNMILSLSFCLRRDHARLGSAENHVAQGTVPVVHALRFPPAPKGSADCDESNGAEAAVWFQAAMKIQYPVRRAAVSMPEPVQQEGTVGQRPVPGGALHRRSSVHWRRSRSR